MYIRKKVMYMIAFMMLFSTITSVIEISTLEKTKEYTQEIVTPSIETFSKVIADGVDWWPTLGHDAQHIGFSTSEAPDTNNVLWTYTTNDSVSSSSVIFNERVYIVSDNGHVYCLDAKTGDEIWNTYKGSVCYSSPAVDDNFLYIGIDHTFYCLDAETGSVIWDYQMGTIESSPVVQNDRVYIGSWDSYVYCFDADPSDSDDEGYDDLLVSYDLIWKYKTGTLVISSPAVTEDKVYIGSSDKKIYCIDATTGTRIWSYTTDGYIRSSPAVIDGYVYVGSEDSKVYCLDANGNGDGTTNLIWSYETGGSVGSSPAVFDEKVYVGSLDKKLYCLDANGNGDGTTNLIWSYETKGTITYHSSPAVADNKVYISSDKFYCLNAADGIYIWNYTTINGGRLPAIAEGRVYVGSESDKIYCFEDAPDENQAPNTPAIISGDTTGFIEEEYTFTVSTIDPDGDTIKYGWDWDDDDVVDEWTNFYPSGELVTTTHGWTEIGLYDIRVKAKDLYGAESGWSSYTSITITSPFPRLIINAPSSIIERGSFDVTITSNGNFIEYVNVEFNGQIKITNSNGQVTFTAPEVIKNTVFDITATLEEYMKDTATIIVLNQKEQQGWIYGVVFESSSPIKNVKIEASDMQKSWSTFTDEEGRYLLPVPPGTYVVKASKVGYKQSTKSDVTINDMTAVESNFILEKQTSSTEEETMNYIDYTIQQKGFEGIIGARMDVDKEESILFYSDSLSIELNATEEYVSFTVSAEDGTSGTILVIRIGEEGVLEDLDNFKVTYDGVPIDEFINIDEFFDIQGNTNPGWLGFLTTTGLYIFVRVPEFSEHTITISSIVEVLGSTTLFIFYIAICIVAVVVFSSRYYTRALFYAFFKMKK